MVAKILKIPSILMKDIDSYEYLIYLKFRIGLHENKVVRKTKTGYLIIFVRNKLILLSHFPTGGQIRNCLTRQWFQLKRQFHDS